MTEPVVYPLPNIASAPTSDVGNLARRLIEYADLSAVRPLLDALKEAGRYDHVSRIIGALGQMMVNHNLDWQFFVIRAGGCLWWDMFDMTESLAMLEGRLKEKPENPWQPPGGTGNIVVPPGLWVENREAILREYYRQHQNVTLEPDAAAEDADAS